MGRRVIVTGAQGFIGSHLAHALLERGDDVVSWDLPDERRAVGVGGLELAGIEGEVEVVEIDIADDTAVHRALSAAGHCDSIFHLAAQTLVGEAARNPVATFRANVTGTWNLLEAARGADCPQVTVASSDKAYGPSGDLPYREDQALAPAAPYEASKAACDVMARSYGPMYGMAVAVTRLANVYGEGDLNFSRLVPEVMAAVVEGRRPQVRSDGSPVRDFLNVKDAVAAYLAIDAALAARSGGGGVSGLAFNAGGGRPYSVREVLGQLAEAVGEPIDADFLGSGNPLGEIDRQYVDAGRLTSLTGWRPEVDLVDGLAQSYDWYARNSRLLSANFTGRQFQGSS